MSRYVHPGISIEELDALGRKFIEKHHAPVDRYAVGGNLSDKYALSFGINDIAKQVNDYTKSQGCSMIDFKEWAFVEVVSKALQEGKDIRLIGFGTFTMHQRKATTGKFKNG